MNRNHLNCIAYLPNNPGYHYYLLLALIGLVSFSSCEYIPVGDPPESSCQDSSAPLISFNDLVAQWDSDLLYLGEDQVLEGYVTSSDEAGNFFNELIIQDQPSQPEHGLRVLLESSNTFSSYPVGTKIRIHLQGLGLDRVSGEWRLGSVQTLFDQPSLTGIPHSLMADFIVKSCVQDELLEPFSIGELPLDQLPLLTLVRLDGMQFIEEDLDKSYADSENETIREFEDCAGQRFGLISSHFSDFQSEPINHGRGSIVGIVESMGSKRTIRIRTLDDLSFQEDRCTTTSPIEEDDNLIFISEIADPNNETGARFIELYNAGNHERVLKGWILQRFTNDSPEVSSETDLSGLRIEAKGTLVLAANGEVFEQVYGRAADAVVSGNSVANSNGDDNFRLLSSLGESIDLFGRIGEDGSLTDHEFEDGRALRRPEIDQGQNAYDPSEWWLWNDSGAAGTENRAQNAPEDYSPGIHPDPME